MHSIGADDVGSAILIALGLLVISLAIVGGLMWWLYKVFRNKED